jgi:hypothetical protein
VLIIVVIIIVVIKSTASMPSKASSALTQTLERAKHLPSQALHAFHALAFAIRHYKVPRVHNTPRRRLSMLNDESSFMGDREVVQAVCRDSACCTES